MISYKILYFWLLSKKVPFGSPGHDFTCGYTYLEQSADAFFTWSRFTTHHGPHPTHVTHFIMRLDPANVCSCTGAML